MVFSPPFNEKLSVGWEISINGASAVMRGNISMEGRKSFYLTLGAPGASVLVAGGTKGFSALGAFFEAGGAEDVQLIIADRIPAPGVETGFAG